MAEYGVVISQSGIPIRQANDYQKSLDSRWKFMEIAVEKDIDIALPNYTADGFYAVKLCDHNLGYLPGFEINEKYPYASPTYTYLSANNPYVTGYVADNQAVYVILQYFVGTYVSLHLLANVRVYALDITQEYQAPSEPPTTAGEPAIDTIGAAFTDQTKGGSVNSTDPETFTMYTPIKSISVHKTGTAQTVSNVLTITHNVNYPPTYLAATVTRAGNKGGFYKDPLQDVDRISPLSATSLGLVVASTSTLKAYGGPQTTLDPSATFAYVILKDPAQVAA